MTFEEKVVEIVASIPIGRVMTYMQVSELAGHPRRARHIGRILWKYEGLLWHRVINSQGKISLPKGQGWELQKALLASESIFLDVKGKVDLNQYLYRVISCCRGDEPVL